MGYILFFLIRFYGFYVQVNTLTYLMYNIYMNLRVQYIIEKKMCLLNYGWGINYVILLIH